MAQDSWREAPAPDFVQGLREVWLKEERMTNYSWF
jgi:hypothetical protein